NMSVPAVRPSGSEQVGRVDCLSRPRLGDNSQNTRRNDGFSVVCKHHAQVSLLRGFPKTTRKNPNLPMKRKKLRHLRTGALIAVGVFLGRGAHADTTITFDCNSVTNHGVLADCIPPQANNPNHPPGITNYANFAAASSPGIAVSGFGTPNIGLTWGSDN